MTRAPFRGADLRGRPGPGQPQAFRPPRPGHAARPAGRLARRDARPARGAPRARRGARDRRPTGWSGSTRADVRRAGGVRGPRDPVGPRGARHRRPADAIFIWGSSIEVGRAAALSQRRQPGVRRPGRGGSATGPFDVLFLPINGRDPARGVPGNMSAAEAVDLAAAVRPRFVVPHHYDMFTFNTVPVERVRGRGPPAARRGRARGSSGAASVGRSRR